MQTQERSEVTIRSFGSGDENIFLDLIKNSFGTLEYPPRLKSELTGSYFDHKGSFIAERDRIPIGCVGLRRFPKENWSEIRYLAVRNNEERIPIAQTQFPKPLNMQR